ncbi:amidohydrolase family protein [Myxococcota bacterium]|nr:amidohydrolase family protein [Myxococcota bacterium]
MLASAALALGPVSAALAADLAIVNTTALPVAGPPVPDAVVLVEDGRVAAIGSGLPVPPGTPVVDGGGGWLMPGLIDVHSHMGVYPWPSARAHEDGNEAIDPVTARVRVEDSVHVSDPAFARARAGGVTTIQVLPGSANLVGGEAVVLKLRPSRTLAGMRFAQAPRGIKMACGENPKRVYGDDEDGPSTRMGNLAALRQAFQAALDYREARRSHRDPPPTDHDQEVLLDVLDGQVRVHLHCYRADDIEGMYRVMDAYGVRITSLQHALEAYKVRDLVAAHGTAVATWPDWWGFKMEAFDGIPHNAALVKQAGVPVAIHSDSPSTVQRLYTEAAKVVRYGMSEEDALAAITLDPARILGVEAWVGSIEVGKQADLALFSRHPLDVTTRVDKTWIEGALVFDRAAEGTPDGRW